jgi:hypothetical protein
VNVKTRGNAEIFSLILVAASLLFLGFQMQQERRIAHAELNTTLLELYSSRLAAGLESDAYLGMWSEIYATKTWETADLSDLEIAAAEVDALIVWTYVEAAFEQYREGLMTEAAWHETELEILQFWKFGAMRAVYDTYYRETPTEFSQTVNQLLADRTAAKGS